MSERERVQRAYMRICRDSRFRLDLVRAAHLTATVLGISAIDVWLALDFSNMERIADGTHPALKLPYYAEPAP